MKLGIVASAKQNTVHARQRGSGTPVDDRHDVGDGHQRRRRDAVGKPGHLRRLHQCRLLRVPAPSTSVATASLRFPPARRRLDQRQHPAVGAVTPTSRWTSSAMQPFDGATTIGSLVRPRASQRRATMPPTSTRRRWRNSCRDLQDPSITAVHNGTTLSTFSLDHAT